MLRQATSQKGHFGFKTSGFACGCPDMLISRTLWRPEGLPPGHRSLHMMTASHIYSLAFNLRHLQGEMALDRRDMESCPHGCRMSANCLGQWESGIPVLPLRRGPENLSAVTLSLDGGEQWAYRKTSPMFRGLFISFSQKAKRFELRTLWESHPFCLP